MTRLSSLMFLTSLLGCGAAPSFDVEMVAPNVRTCIEQQDKLIDAIEYWNERGTDLCWQGCRVDKEYGPDIQYTGDGQLRGLGEGRQDMLSFYVAWSIQKDGSYAIDGIMAQNLGCSFAGAVKYTAGTSAYAHELGHFMGLGHYDADDHNLMYPNTRNFPQETLPWQEEEALDGLSWKNEFCGTGQRVRACEWR